MQLFHFSIDCLQYDDDTQVVPWFRFVWVCQGTGSLFIDMNQYDIRSNCIYFIKPGQVYAMHGEYEGHIISFTGSFLGMDDEKFDAGYTAGLLHFFSRQACVLQADAMTDIKETIEKLVKEHQNINMFRAEILKRYFKILLIYLTRQFEEYIDNNTQTRDIEVVGHFMHLLEKEFLLKKMVSDYAERLFLTPNYLNQIIKKLTGHSAGYHIRQRIVLEAKREAVYSDKSMKEIAYMLGFSDVCHFSKFFKKLTGMNFIDFRKNKPVVPFIPEV
jgi:AraC-like DNA-binding protein